MRKWFFIFICVGFTAMTRAQGVEIGAMLGGALYSGDLSPSEFGLYFDEVRPAGGIFGRIHLNRALALRAGVNMGRIGGQGNIPQGGTVFRPSFRNNLLEFSLVGEVYPFTIGNGGFQFKPYLFGGGAVFRSNPQGKFDGSIIDLQMLGTEGQGLEGYDDPYSLTQFSLPFGGGIKFVINDTWTIGAEIGWRKTFTDYLDDIGSTTVNYQDVYNGNGELAALFSNALISGPEVGDVSYKRGGEFNDWYYMGGITVSYIIDGGGGRGSRLLGGRRRGKAIGCPTF